MLAATKPRRPEPDCSVSSAMLCLVVRDAVLRGHVELGPHRRDAAPEDLAPSAASRSPRHGYRELHPPRAAGLHRPRRAETTSVSISASSLFPRLASPPRHHALLHPPLLLCDHLTGAAAAPLHQRRAERSVRGVLIFSPRTAAASPFRRPTFVQLGTSSPSWTGVTSSSSGHLLDVRCTTSPII